MAHPASPPPAFRLPEPVERILGFLVLPLLGALTATSLTTPPATDPFGLLRVAEAPAVEVAGVRATGDLAQDVAARLPLGASDASPESRAQTTVTDAGAQLTTPDGLAFRLPPGDTSTTSLAYRPLSVPPAAVPAPRLLHLFALSAAGSDGRPVQTFSLPLTVTVPFEPASVAGWLALAIYDPDADGWVELPVRAINRQRATVSAQTYRPGVIALVENRPPLAAPDETGTASNASVTVDILANDADPDGDPLAVFERTASSAAGGAVRCSQIGACVYTPPNGFTGLDRFTYGLGDLRTHATGVQTWSDNTVDGVVIVRVGT